MRDYFSENYEWDGAVPRKKKRVLGDHEHLHVPMMMMDSAMNAAGFNKTFSDGSPDLTSPHKPGFRFLDVNDKARIAADVSYREMCARMDCRHRQQDGVSDHGSRQLTLDELEQAASAAYEARSARMRTAWKDHHA